MKKITILIFICSLLLACSKNNEENAPREVEQVIKYELVTVASPSDGGTVSPDKGEYDKNLETTIKATPGTEYVFVEWTGGATGSENPITLKMDADKNVTAVFEKKNYALTVAIQGEGIVKETVMQAGKSTDYTSGTVVELSANASDGKRFIKWTGDYEGIENPIQLTIDRVTDLTAVFGEGLSNAVEVDFEISEGGKLEIRNIDTNETVKLNKSLKVSFEMGSVLEVKAISHEGYHFDGWSGIVNDRLQLIDGIIITADNVILNSHFSPKDTGALTRRTSFLDETVLDYRGSQHFMVWWDKDWDHNHDAKDILKWAEYTYAYGIENGMEPPVGSETHYINIYMHHKGNDGDGVDVLPDGWGQGVDTDEYDMPYYTAPGHLERHVLLETRPVGGSVLHEIFHIMQYKAGNHYNTFSYEYAHNRWYVESTASAFEDVRTTPKEWYGDYNIIPSFTMQPQIALWGPAPEITTIMRNGRQYAGVLFFMYLHWNQLIPESFIGQSFYSGYDKTPQEYLYENLPDFKGTFRQFARDITVLNNVPDQPKEDIKNIQEWWRLYGEDSGNSHEGSNDDNSFCLELTDSGTTGYFSPVDKNMAWSHTVIKINNTSQSSYSIDFIGDLLGNEGTTSDFYISTIIDIEENYTFSQIPLTNQSGKTTIEVPSNAALYLIVVSTPELFVGDEEFDYQLKIDRL